MSNSVCLVAHEVIQTISSVCVYEAVADPLTGKNGLIDFFLWVQCIYDALIVDKACLLVCEVRVPRIFYDVEGFFTGNRAKFTGFRPIDLLPVSALSLKE